MLRSEFQKESRNRELFSYNVVNDIADATSKGPSLSVDAAVR